MSSDSSSDDTEQIDWGAESIPFEEGAARAYLDECIQHWRESDKEYSEHYVDAYQSVRASLFGDTLPTAENRSVDTDTDQK